MDKQKEILLTALREGMTQPGEKRLYRSGKLPGLFTGRTSVNSEVAAQAIRDGLIDLVRTDIKGKTAIEWVKITQKGIDFVLQQDSPVRAMDELKAILQVNGQGIPQWVAELRQNLQELDKKFLEEVQSIRQKLEALTGRVLEALKRAEQAVPTLPGGGGQALNWGEEALAYLDRRQQGGLNHPCPLPELFEAVRKKQADFSIQDFHSGLRRLHDHGVLHLQTHEGSEGPAEPEYALLDGAKFYYYASR